MATNGPRAPNLASIPSPYGEYPASYDIKGFHILTRIQPILPSDLEKLMADQLGIPVPEMLFGDNIVTVEHPASGWGIKFDAFGALDRVNKTGEKMLKVSYSQKWHESRADTHEIKAVVRPFDWSFTTDYKGDVAPDGPQFHDSAVSIPFEVLRRFDKILLSQTVDLYEDELADNGTAKLVVRVRVMHTGVFILSRFFMRLDRVLLRIRDTRVYVDFDKKEAIREYVARENDYEPVRAALAVRREDLFTQLDDPEAMVELLPVVEKTLERADFATPRNPGEGAQSVENGIQTYKRGHNLSATTKPAIRNSVEAGCKHFERSASFTELQSPSNPVELPRAHSPTTLAGTRGQLDTARPQSRAFSTASIGPAEEKAQTQRTHTVASITTFSTLDSSKYTKETGNPIQDCHVY